MIEFILSHFRIQKQATKIETSLSRLESKIQTVQIVARAAAAKAEERTEAANKAASHLQQENKALLRSMDEYRITVAKLEETLEAAREELRTAKLITIPGLVEANQTMLARWEAETQIQIARAVLVRKEE